MAGHFIRHSSAAMHDCLPKVGGPQTQIFSKLMFPAALLLVETPVIVHEFELPLATGSHISGPTRRQPL